MTTKEALLKLLDEVEDLRANQIVLAGRVAALPSIAIANEVKSLALQESRKSYDELRKEIGALA